MRIGIIGAGASGLMTAICASASEKNEIFLFERQDRVGRKILSTGNGRCNLTNVNMDPGRYHGTGAKLAWKLISEFGPQETFAFFRELGLITVIEPEGRAYPFSDKANSVLDILRSAADRKNIHPLTGVRDIEIRKTKKGFSVSYKYKEKPIEEEIAHKYDEEPAYKQSFDKIVICCGSEASPKLGATGDGYGFLRAFGHKFIETHPALVRLKCNREDIKGLKGIRQSADISLCYKNGTVIAQNSGEIQFTDAGLSGPCIFDISGNVSKDLKPKYIKADLMPLLTADEVTEYIRNKIARNRVTPAKELFTGMFHSRIGLSVAQKSEVFPDMPIGYLKENDIERLVRTVKGYKFRDVTADDFRDAQVAAGGIDARDFSDSLESKLCPGLYAAGEVLDIDGDCGGYNLQWAWTSGYTVGSALRDLAENG